MASPYYNRLHLDILVEMLTYDPNNDAVINVDAKDSFDTTESDNVQNYYGFTIQLKKDDADVEVIPASLTGVKFAYVRVKKENLTTTPVKGTVTAKITSAVGTDQQMGGDLIMIRDVDALISSIKLTNNEDDTSGITLPVLILLGGINT